MFQTKLKLGNTTIFTKSLYCNEKDTVIKGNVGVTSNFLTHLKRKHETEYLDYVKRRKLECDEKRVEMKQYLFQQEKILSYKPHHLFQ